MKQKWIERGSYALFAVLIGAAVGVIDAIFGRGLLRITAFRENHFSYLIPFLPLAGVWIVWGYRRFSRESLKGMTLVFEAGQQKREKIPMALVPLVMVGTWITHLFGGSAGREGVAVQIGATLAHGIGSRFSYLKNTKILVIMGMAAGFGGLFRTPLAAVFFALEVMTVGVLAYEALVPSLIAAYTASFVSGQCGLEKFTVSLGEKIEVTHPEEVAKLLLLGIAFGLTGRLFSFFLGKMKKIAGEKVLNPYVRILAGSVVLALIFALLWQGRYSGLGTNLITAAFEGGKITYYDWVLKLVLTVLTLAIGFQGGEVTPLFAIGASLGIVLGPFLGLPAMACGAIGYAAVFGSATNTLLAPIFIGLEVFSSQNILPCILVCIFSYIISGDGSIYSAQEKPAIH
ncbi:MAG: chloride channel protein [Clostridiales bacterium]|nr:chloride channel protein [Clostridiales bacterium]